MARRYHVTGSHILIRDRRTAPGKPHSGLPLEGEVLAVGLGVGSDVRVGDVITAMRFSCHAPGDEVPEADLLILDARDVLAVVEEVYP